MFDRDFSQPLSARLVFMVFGRPKIGKTRLALDLAKKGQYVMMISCDRGARFELHRNSKDYQGHVALAEVSGLAEFRKALGELKVNIGRLVKAGIPAGKIWVVVDTLTHMQAQLLQEARRIDQKNPGAVEKSREDFLRDFTTQVDWGINLTLMGEQSDAMLALPCNVVYIALEKTEKPKGQSEKPAPAMSGQSKERFLGDSDVILHMTRGNDKELQLETSYAGGAGDRTGLLDPIEPPDLLAIYNKVYGSADQPSEPGNPSSSEEGSIDNQQPAIAGE
jgi:hypothetical protein